MFLLYSVFVIFITCKLGFCYEYFLSNVSGEAEKGNFVYYSMTYEGTILLELISLTGDCDLYVSQNTKTPSYDPESNCMSSITCGLDSVIIPRSFKRPVGIGIFSHPSHDICSYNLVFYKIDDSRDTFNFDPYKDSLQTEINKQLHVENKDSAKAEDESESLLSIFLKYIIEFLIEIIL